MTPNIGHWFPKDFGQRLDRAIARILAGGYCFTATARTIGVPGPAQSARPVISS